MSKRIFGAVSDFEDILWCRTGGHWTGMREAICFDKEAAATEANLDDQWHNRHIVTVELVNVRLIS